MRAESVSALGGSSIKTGPPCHGKGDGANGCRRSREDKTTRSHDSPS